MPKPRVFYFLHYLANMYKGFKNKHEIFFTFCYENLQKKNGVN